MANGVDQRLFSREYKLAVIERMASGEPVSALSRELGIARKCLYQWRDRYRIGGAIARRPSSTYAVIEAMTAYVLQGEGNGSTIERWCRLAESRAGYYRRWQASAPKTIMLAEPL